MRAYSFASLHSPPCVQTFKQHSLLLVGQSVNLDQVYGQDNMFDILML